MGAFLDSVRFARVADELHRYPNTFNARNISAPWNGCTRSSESP